MTDQEGGIDLIIHDLVEQNLGVSLYVSLSASYLQSLLHQRAQGKFIDESAIHAWNRDAATLAAGKQGFAQSMRAVCPHPDLLFYKIHHVIQRKAVRFSAHRVDHRVGTDTSRH